MRFVGVAAAILGAALVMGQARADEPVHLRMGWVVVPADIIPLMYAKPELAPHAGKTYVAELTHFAGTSTEMTALAAGELDVAALAYSTFALGIENAGMDDLRAIADVFQDGVPGYHTNGMVVRDGSPVRSVEDLKGKVIATNETGSAVDVAVRAMLAKHGLKDKRDVTMIEVRFPDMKAMLKEGKVDMITAVNPFGFDPELTGFSRVLFTQQEAIGRTQMIVVVARAGFIEKHRAAMVDFLQDYIAALQFFGDPSHHDEAVRLASEVTKQKPELYSGWLFTDKDYFRDPQGLPNLDALQANVGLAKDMGFLHATIDVAKYSDLSLAKEAAQRLAPSGNH
jgi:sulfonate transport system substrate-binding protein